MTTARRCAAIGARTGSAIAPMKLSASGSPRGRTGIMGYSYGAHLGSGFVRHRTTPPCRRRSVPADHARAELGEFLVDLRRAGVMRRNAAMFGRETERERNLEILKCLHLPIEPGECIGAETIRPGEAGAQMLDSKALQPTHRVVEAMIP